MGSLESATVVITGASSGIGRAAALTFVCEGANVVLAARRETALQELAETCNVAAGRALVVPTDVTAPESVADLARTAAESFNRRIDVWINNAGVGAVGEFNAIPIETHDRVIQTNLMGYLHGAHAVLPYFKQQSRGVLINTISLGGWVAAPYAVAYSASKFGLRGYSEALRAELRHWPDIHVCDVFPAFIDTPGFQHGANYFGREIKPVPPVYQAERVAQAMVSLAKHPRSATTVGASAYVARFAHSWLGDRATRLMAMVMSRYLANAKAAPVGDGDLFEPQSSSGQVSGGWR
jgi:short-subunit dehydrogenase